MRWRPEESTVNGLMPPAGRIATSRYIVALVNVPAGNSGIAVKRPSIAATVCVTAANCMIGAPKQTELNVVRRARGLTVVGQASLIGNGLRDRYGRGKGEHAHDGVKTAPQLFGSSALL